jgi:hypothetical protein
MAFRQLVQDATFDPEAIEVMSAAYEGVCKTLGLTDHTDPITQLVAKKILELAARGERDPDRLHGETLKVFGHPQ